MKKRIRSVLLILLTAFISLPAISQQYLNQIVGRGKLRVGMSGTQPPFCMKDTSGNFVGYEVELAEMLAYGMGVNQRNICQKRNP
ncbi:MAG: transporter substrate-binding domain-containing protein [Bacteroidetes bacterium]|nr:transporter substrate-binding domain-containing protein [Bacteroidota bacterium]